MSPTQPSQNTYEPGQYNPHVDPVIPPPGHSPSSGNKTTILALIALLVIVVAGVFTFSSGKSTTSPGTASISVPAAADVSITNLGFNPVTVDIKVGQAVTWINDDSAPHTVASDPYPTDNTLADFNSKGNLSTNDSYSFVFNKPGTYTYHDDLNPYTLQGTVVVKQ